MSQSSSFPAPTAALLPLAHVNGLSSNLATISVNGLYDLLFVSFPNFITVGISERMLFLEPVQQYKEYNKNTARVQYICYPEGLSFCKDAGNSTSWEPSLIYWSSKTKWLIFHISFIYCGRAHGPLHTCRVKGQPAGVCFLFPLCGFQGLNSSHLV